MARVKYVATAVTQGTRYKNAALAVGLVGFVGGVYFFTYGKMKTVRPGRSACCAPARAAWAPARRCGPAGARALRTLRGRRAKASTRPPSHSRPRPHPASPPLICRMSSARSRRSSTRSAPSSRRWLRSRQQAAQAARPPPPRSSSEPFLPRALQPFTVLFCVCGDARPAAASTRSISYATRPSAATVAPSRMRCALPPSAAGVSAVQPAWQRGGLWPCAVQGCRAARRQHDALLCAAARARGQQRAHFRSSPRGRRLPCAGWPVVSAGGAGASST
jgi:hypothetical protein